MAEALQGLLGFALIIGLFVYYARERRANKHLPASTVVDVIANDPTVSAETEVRGSSPNWGAPIVYVLLLVAAQRSDGSWWRMLWLSLYFSIFGVAWYSMFSDKEFADEVARRPGTTRREQYFKIGVPYLLFPFLGWLGVIVFGWRAAVLIPAIPWLALVVAGLFVAAGMKIQRR